MMARICFKIAWWDVCGVHMKGEAVGGSVPTQAEGTWVFSVQFPLLPCISIFL